MDRTNQQQPPRQRDMVYCHQCENEWYRDEHGLTCPECQSDFTEIIEAEHDPRDDHLPDLEPPDHDRGEYYGTPDPDEGDIDGLRWQQTGPGQVRGTFNRTYQFGGGQGDQQQGQQGQQGGGLGGIFGGMLGSLVQGAMNNVAQRQQQPGQAQPGQEQRPQSPEGGPGGRAASAPDTARAGTTVRHYHGPLGHMTIATSSNVGGNLHPRDANAPQPFQVQPNYIDQIMQQMVMNIGPGGPHGMGGGQGGLVFADGGMGGGQNPFAAGPFGNVFSMLNGMTGMGGDAVFSQEEMDRVITRMMEENQTGHAPGPASEAAIRALPTRPIEAKDLADNGKAECTICMDEVLIGNSVTVLPCSHWFHDDCITAWLSEHDTCPHCRQGIMPKDETSSNSARQPSQAPLNDMSNPAQVPGSFPGAAPDRQETSGSRQQPESPSLHRRASSTSSAGRQASSGGRQGSSRGGMFKGMRDAFGGSRNNNNNGEGGSGGGPGAAGS
ncbi:hypothetical protein LTR36_004102 [Oleoguttula mirabilis]|uniref:RING-type E3 ubiquitin transferase n=1 Tax=Oleoguttula mirabilis TaxID=1507867 RepID=A0AAV9JHS3_9PEZI|nr:hypothetical protein LTR36_004102 [Oleoguttula mirabilis]